MSNLPTPAEAQAELARRRSMQSMPTPAEAQAELARRQELKMQQSQQQPTQQTTPQLQESLLHKAANSWPVNATLGVGDAVRDLLSLGTTKNHPMGEGKSYEAGKIAGDIGGFIGGGELLDTARAGMEALPYIGRGAQWLGREGIPGIARRLSGSTLFGTAEHPEDRLKGAKEGAIGGLIGEGLTAPFRAVGALAERANPLRFAANEAGNIREGYHAAQAEQRAAYQPVMSRYGHQWLTPTPREYLGFTPSETRYFTPDVRKSYQDFLDEPTFNNLHDLQSQMGRDASRVSTSPSKINTAQTLTGTRQTVNQRISNFLSHDPEMAQQYELGREISREQFFPYHSNPTLQKISQGMIRNPTPQQLNTAITKGTQKVSHMAHGAPVASIPENHALTQVLGRLHGRMNQADLIKSLMPLAGSGLGVLGGIPGAAIGGAVGHYISPHALAAAQNPIVQNIARVLGLGTRAVSQQYFEH